MEIGLDEQHFGIGGDGVSEPDIGTDDGAGADGRLTAENRRVGINGYVVFDGRVAFGDVAGIGIGNADGAERDALIHLDAFADNGRFADDDAGSVIDEETLADLCAGVDVDAGAVVYVFAHHAGEDGDAALMEDVRESVDGEGTEAGIGQDDFGGTFGGRIAFVCGSQVGVKDAADRRQLLKEAVDDGFRLCRDGERRIGQCHAAFGAGRCVTQAVRDEGGE